ncbi:MAG: hypothetical protein HQM13_01835 [SAR324 cluster bacterium]|nr:hypothetical protein [SAR324 cluster bacterium]
MLATALIIDEFAVKGRVGPFWRKVSPIVLKQLSPVQVSQTHAENSISPLLEEAIKNGYKKLILVGDQSTMFAGINALMQFPQDLRKQLAIGLWLLNDWEMLLYSTRFSGKLDCLINILKAAHTCPVDLGKVSLTRGDQKPKILHFWRRCDFSYIEGSSLKNSIVIPVPPFLTQLIPFRISTKARLQIEHQSFHAEGGLNLRILLHPERPHSLNVLPETLKSTPKFDLLWQRGIYSKGEWIRFPWITLEKKRSGFGKTEQKNCLLVKIQSDNEPLSLRLDGQRHRCTNAYFEIVREALPIIVKMIPAHSKMPAKSILNPAKSSGVIANRKPYNNVKS